MKFIPALLLSCLFISSLTLITPAMAQRGGPGMGGGGMGGGGMGGRMGPAMGGPSMGGRIDRANDYRPAMPNRPDSSAKPADHPAPPPAGAQKPTEAKPTNVAPTAP